MRRAYMKNAVEQIGRKVEPLLSDPKPAATTLVESITHPGIFMPVSVPENPH